MTVQELIDKLSELPEKCRTWTVTTFDSSYGTQVVEIIELTENAALNEPIAPRVELR